MIRIVSGLAIRLRRELGSGEARAARAIEIRRRRFLVQRTRIANARPAFETAQETDVGLGLLWREVRADHLPPPRPATRRRRSRLLSTFFSGLAFASRRSTNSLAFTKRFLPRSITVIRSARMNSRNSRGFMPTAASQFNGERKSGSAATLLRSL